ncbi:MAG: EAL domain-containing protein [Thiomonas sp.]|uniref:EAL domain-containing protein n=1 Tax=Thiomonas sp. TaxID=2047785 RepID=UPI002A370C51|nr:EAL domain-containing protein [Thiomonas sp.]MDY0329466.1 EAL domain-containing protein [Thiomonas sp.]
MQDQASPLWLLDLPGKMLQGLAEGRPIAELAALLCRLTEQVAPGRIASILRLGEDGTLHPLAIPSAAPELSSALDGLKPGPHAGSCGNAVLLDAPTFVEDIAADPRWDDLRAVAEQWKLRSCWSWPVRDGEQVIGSFALTGPAPGAPDAEALRLLEFVASLVGTLLRMEQLQRERRAAQERLQWQARHDALTGLPNRYALDEWLPQRLAQAQQRGEAVAVGLLDLDDFKALNDQLGHAAGDDALRNVAAQLGDALGGDDLLVRTGGDEFVLVLCGLSDPADLERWLQALDALLPLAVPLADGSSADLGLSLGLALYPADGLDPDTLLRHADAALLRVKRLKRTRARWWLRWGQETEADDDFDTAAMSPYGPQAQALLRQIAAHAQTAAEDFTDAFYAQLRHDTQARSLLDHLTGDEFAHLKSRQAEHFQRLLDPRLSEAEHLEKANRIGAIHALVGVPARLLVQATGQYLQTLTDLSQEFPLRAHDRRRLTYLLSARLRLELQAEIEAAQALRERFQQCVIDLENAALDGAAWSEFMQQALDRLAALPGMRAAFIGAPDANGEFVIEISSGFAPYARAMRKHYGSLKTPKLQSARAESIGPTARAWQTEQICTVANFGLDPAGVPWREAALEAGIRSVASVPLTDRNGRVVVVLNLYGGYPAMFERSAARSFLDNLGQTLNRAWQRLHAPTRQQPVPVALRQRWRSSLFDHGLEMHLQPVVDLQTGQPYAVEALARLRMDDGSLAMPGQFLPWFGHAELSRLFYGGLQQTLAHLARWDTADLRLNLSLNLPLDVLLQESCRHRVESALRQAGVAAERLSLEMLESAEFDDPQRRDDAVRDLAATGVQLVMDDLGSGYSSLLRLRTLPFHTVKIDQGLVREAGRDPEQAIGFIGALVQLAQSLGLWVVVEGLETPDLVEAATLLGADAGQGYALARPMPAADVAHWVRDFRCPVDLRQPITRLGRMAQEWMAQHGSRLADESARQLLRSARRQALNART